MRSARWGDVAGIDQPQVGLLAYNQATAGLIKQLEMALNGQTTDGNAAFTPGG
jgi:hypothetical protein